MQSHSSTTSIGGTARFFRRGLWGFLKLARLVLLTGPFRLLFSSVSGRCAALMVLMCVPSILICAILTVPGMLFHSPQQQAYFYFASALGQDPVRWLAIILAACCTTLSLALPGTIDGDPPVS